MTPSEWGAVATNMSLLWTPLLDLATVCVQAVHVTDALTPDVMAQQLRDHLEKIDMSQAEFARKAGVSTKHVSQVLSAKAHAPLATLDYWAFIVGMRWSIRLVRR